ncbi:scavenger receptor class B member 1-like isoform X2 [Tetranychus urticae]|uniref:scavenger receptor class B member 1-like isoform X2 n=1 Tax=Tetranychus urticae TaxID=32264 RepID=UPI00077BF07A|nr:scavenger receptor class B member 1-like isoform X2 [Tetranychus urticae]
MANDTEDKDVESKKDKSKPKRPLRFKFIRYGAIAGVLGTLFAALQPWAMEKAISSQIKVDPTSPGYMFWEHVPLPIITKFHLFNIENPGEFLKGGKLRVRELGPFTLKQDRWKEVIEFTEKTVKYYEWRNYTIAEELSVGSWDQEITVLNPMVASIGSIVGDKLEQLIPIPLAVSPFVYSTVSALLLVHSQNFFLKTTPRNVIVGQRINLLDTVTTLVKPLELLGVKASDLIPTDDLPNNTFGLINGKNYTRMGPWEVYTGVDVPKELYTNAVAFKNEKLMKRWAGPECNTPRGTDGIQFQPLINRTTKLTIFSGDIYRSLDLIYAEDYDYMGIQTYKYILDPAIFQPPSVNPDNACYCVHTGKKKARCEYEGILDLTGGFSGSPFVVTKPHFLEAPEVQKLVDGLSPDPEKHTFYLLIKPDIGVPISAKGRLQFNLRVEKVPFLRGFNNIRDTIIPLGWIEEGGSIDGVLYYLMRGGLVIAPMAASAGFYGAAIGGWAAFLAGLIYTVFRKSGKGKVDNMEKLFEPRESPTKKELIGDSKKMKSQSKLSMNQSDQQSPMNGVLVPVDYVQPSEMNNGLTLVNGSSFVQGRTGPISIIPVNSDMYQPSSVIQFYRLPPGVNQGGGQFDQLLLTIPNANQEMNSPGTVPKITWNGRGSQSVKERTGKVRDKMSRGQSLPRERASQRSKRIQVNSKETQDRFVQTRPSLSEAAERSVSATLPGEYISGNQKTLVDENNNIRLAKSKSGPRSSYSAVSRYQSIDPGEPYDDGDETMLFQRDSTTESEATTPQSDDTDDKQEVKSYQKEGVNDLPGVETPERLATPSFSDEFSIGSDTSRASTAKSLIEPKTNKKETKQNSSCIVS